jgi:ABC-2 type transport system permease protein
MIAVPVGRLIVRQVRYENTAFWRNPAAAFFTFAFPLIFMAVFNLILAGEPGSDTAAQFYTPAIITFSIVNACYTSIAMTVSLARDEGILKRVRGTPLPGWAYLVARMLHAVLVAILLVVIVAIVGRLFFSVALPLEQLPLLVVVLFVAGASFCALGLAMAAVIPNAAAAPAIVNATVLPLYFISNVFVRLDESNVLAQIGNLFPIRHLANALQSVWNPVVHPFDPLDLAWIAGWGLLGLLVAVRTFTWEPRT